MRNIVQKYSNGTALIKNAVLNTDGNAPDPRISMGFGVGENGEIRHYNNPNDPMPIKTINMNGIKKWEETDDYIIYVDKDAVETLVENYQVGAYDLFLERKANVDGSMELLRGNGIEWTSSDDSMLMLDVNEQLYRKSLLRDSVDMLPGDIEIQSTTRAVPTTYECCFRTDKKSGEIYIGEGYENLFGVANENDFSSVSKQGNTYVEIESSGPHSFARRIRNEFNAIGETFSITAMFKNVTALEFYIRVGAGFVGKNKNGNVVVTGDLTNAGLEGSTLKATRTVVLGNEIYFGQVGFGTFEIGRTVDIGASFECDIQITKTSTPKPFVKSVMPSGKLSFVTNATSESHSFVMKGIDGKDGFEQYIRYYKPPIALKNGRFDVEMTADELNNFGKSSFLIYKTTSNFILKNGVEKKAELIPSQGSVGGLINLHIKLDLKPRANSFKQLLIYKGNLTEAELKTENEKEIKLERLYSLDDQVSLNFKCDENGLQYYNNPNDPMPIKTINMNGIKKWEETDDYIIYVDRDAVMTTVQQYVTGTYDLFLERKNQVDGSMELLRDNNIEWTAEDDSKLLQDINLAQLEKTMSSPSTLEEDSEIQTFEARTVPTTYECCFRTDKKSGEIYVGEGYENLLVKKVASTSNYEINQNLEENIITYNVINSYTQNSSLPLVSSNVSIINCFFSLDILKNTFNRTVSPSGYSGFYPPIGKHERIITNTGGWTHAVTLFNWGSDVFTDVQAGEQIIIKNAMVVNSLTPKPFVKSVMPNGKLSFVTNATSESHSFVGKDNKNFFESEVASFSLIAQSNPSISIEQKEKVIWIGDDE